MNKELEPLMIYKQYIELIYYTNSITKKYPKNEKTSIVYNIENYTYHGMEVIIKAQREFSKQTS